MNTTLIVEAKPDVVPAVLIASISAVQGVKAVTPIFPSNPELQQFYAVDAEQTHSDEILAVLKSTAGVHNVERPPQRKTMDSAPRPSGRKSYPSR